MYSIFKIIDKHIDRYPIHVIKIDDWQLNVSRKIILIKVTKVLRVLLMYFQQVCNPPVQNSASPTFICNMAVK